MTRSYVENMKKFALAAWEVDRDMHILASVNVGANKKNLARGSKQYNLSSKNFK